MSNKYKYFTIYDGETGDRKGYKWLQNEEDVLTELQSGNAVEVWEVNQGVAYLVADYQNEFYKTDSDGFAMPIKKDK